MTNVRVAPGELVDVVWLNSLARGAYRKTTSKQVVSTNAETDLLNGEITVGGGVLGATGVLRVTAAGDWINNTGATIALPRFKLKLGLTTLIDTNAPAAAWAASASRFGWRIAAEIALQPPSGYWATIDGRFSGSLANNILATFTTGEGTFGTDAADHAFAIGGSSGAVDTSVDRVLALTVTLPTANALEDCTLRSALIEII